jgi:hypothetical protein
METSYEKVDYTTMKVTKEVEIKTEEKTYDLDFLKQQEIDIIRQIDEFVALREKELLEVRTLIAESAKLGIVSKQEVSEIIEEALVAEESVLAEEPVEKIS